MYRSPATLAFLLSEVMSPPLWGVWPHSTQKHAKEFNWAMLTTRKRCAMRNGAPEWALIFLPLNRAAADAGHPPAEKVRLEVIRRLRAKAPTDFVRLTRR